MFSCVQILIVPTLLAALTACKTTRQETVLLETRPYYCANKTGEHCTSPVSVEPISVPKGTTTIFLTWPVTLATREQTLELKTCVIVHRETKEESAPCEIEPLKIEAMPRGESATYTSRVGIPSDLRSGTYSLGASFEGPAGLIFPFVYLKVLE